MSAAIQRSLLSLVMFSWGVMLLYFFASGRLMKYLAPDFRAWVLIGGLGLCVIGLFNLLTSKHDEDCGHEHGPEDEHDHDAPNPLVAIAIMIVPVALSLSWTKDGEFSLEVLQRKGLQDSPGDALFLASSLPPLTKEIIEKQHPANSDGYREFRLMELFFATADSEMRNLIDGMPVVVEGRLVPDGDSPPTQQRLYRLFITCCAADSRAIPIVVRFDENEVPQVEENAWMKISGTITYPDEGRGPEPVLMVDIAESSEAPMEESFMRGY